MFRPLTATRMRRCARSWQIFFLLGGMLLSVAAAAQDTGGKNVLPGKEKLRKDIALRPEARPDTATVQAGERVRIDVLKNDEGAPSDPSVVPDMRIESSPTCGKADLDGRFVSYQGGGECVGTPVTFSYSARLHDSLTDEDEWVTGPITVTV